MEWGPFELQTIHSRREEITALQCVSNYALVENPGPETMEHLPFCAELHPLLYRGKFCKAMNLHKDITIRIFPPSYIHYLNDRASWLNYSNLIKQKFMMYNRYWPSNYYLNLKNVFPDFQSSSISPKVLGEHIYLKYMCFRVGFSIYLVCVKGVSLEKHNKINPSN